MPNHHVTGRQTATCGFTGFSTYLAAGLMVATITVDAAADANVRIMPMGLLGQRTVRDFMASGWQERLEVVRFRAHRYTARVSSRSSRAASVGNYPSVIIQTVIIGGHS